MLHRFSGFVLALVLVVCVSAAQQEREEDLDTCGPWIPIPLSSVPPALPGDSITVLFLIAPLEECSYGDQFKALDAYHGGVGLVNTRTKNSVTLNFDASPSFAGALVPQIAYFPNGTVSNLTWANYGRSFIYQGINTTYWEQIQPVATMTGTQFNTFMLQWLGTTNDTYFYYNLWSVWSGWPGKEILSNFECFEFVWAAFANMKSIGVTFSVTSLKMSFVSLYTDRVPQKIDSMNSTLRDQVGIFYETLQFNMQELGLFGFLDSLWEILYQGDFYVRDNDQYFYVHVVEPWVGFHFVDMPLFSN